MSVISHLERAAAEPLVVTVQWIMWGRRIPGGWRLLRPQFMRRHAVYGRLAVKVER